MIRVASAALGALVAASCAPTPPEAPMPSPPLAAPTSEPPVAPSSSPPQPSAPSEAPSASAPAPSSTPRARTRDCDPGGKAPSLCVAPTETEGPLRAGACREAPRRAVCTGCRPVFEKAEGGRCCYVGLSRFPRCAD